MSLITTATEAAQQNHDLMLLVHGLNFALIIIKFIVAFFGSAVILIGAYIAAYRYSAHRLVKSAPYNLNNIRLDLAQTILLALEFFVASDVVETMIAPDFHSLGILAILVVIRTFLNFSIQHEVDALSVQDKQRAECG